MTCAARRVGFAILAIPSRFTSIDAALPKSWRVQLRRTRTTAKEAKFFLFPHLLVKHDQHLRYCSTPITTTFGNAKAALCFRTSSPLEPQSSPHQTSFKRSRPCSDRKHEAGAGEREGSPPPAVATDRFPAAPVHKSVVDALSLKLTAEEEEVDALF